MYTVTANYAPKKEITRVKIPALLSCDGITFLGILIVYTEGIIHACRQNIIITGFKFYNWYHTDIIKSSDIKLSGNKV